jgi:pimeloyl-ACP methyl ester carboxylesterase
VAAGLGKRSQLFGPSSQPPRPEVAPLLTGCTVVAPDLRGFGESDKHPATPAEAYSADAQARSVVGLIDELGLGPAVVAGYDVGSRVAQTVARLLPDRVHALVVSPPLPGAGKRVLEPEAEREFRYQAFHQLSEVARWAGVPMGGWVCPAISSWRTSAQVLRCCSIRSSEELS